MHLTMVYVPFCQIGTYDQELKMDGYVAKTSDSTAAPFTSSCPIGDRCSCVDFSGKEIATGRTSGDGGNVAPVTNMRLYDNIVAPWGIVVAALTALGIIATICAFVYLLIFYPVKGGTSVLGYLLLFGVLLM